MSELFTADEFADGTALARYRHIAFERLEAGELGTTIAVPPRNLIERGSLPLVGAHVTRPGAPDAPPLDRAAILVACELDTNELHVARAFPPPEFAEPVAKAGGQALTGFGFSLDLAERLALPKRPGRYMLWMIVRERVTAPVRFRLEHGPSTYHDHAVDDFLRREQAERGPREIFPPPGPTLPYYAGGSASEPPREWSWPEQPERGLELELPRVAYTNQPALLRASFRVPARVYERCAYAAQPTHGPDLRGPSAIVSLRLIVTAADQIGPQVHELAVPSYTRFHPDEVAPLVSGRFALDLLALPGAWTQPRSYFIYTLAGGQLSGPHILSLVTPEMVPGQA